MGKVLVTGGAGYVGRILIPKLLEAGHPVRVYDALFYGPDAFPAHPSLRVIPGDIRDLATFQELVKGCGAVIHLAATPYDSDLELDPALCRSINLDCFQGLVTASRDAGVRRFVFASSSSVYGSSQATEVTEEHPLSALNEFDRCKAACEPILLEYQTPEFTTVILRTGTVCGYSPRMRFDLVLNDLVNQAYNRGVITIEGGDQTRPHVHIADLTDVYVHLLQVASKTIGGQIFNVGHQNFTIRELAAIVQNVVEEEKGGKRPSVLETARSKDRRSYRLCSKKLADTLGWIPQKDVEAATRELCEAFKNGLIPESLTDDRYHSVRALKQAVLA